jgi:hypothetical protein
MPCWRWWGKSHVRAVPRHYAAPVVVSLEEPTRSEVENVATLRVDDRTGNRDSEPCLFPKGFRVEDFAVFAVQLE